MKKMKHFELTALPCTQGPLCIGLATISLIELSTKHNILTIKAFSCSKYFTVIAIKAGSNEVETHNL